MSSTDSLSDTAPAESSGPPNVADPSDLVITFSAPFYTGVFLSSRELQGDYKYSPKEATEDDSDASADLNKEQAGRYNSKEVTKDNSDESSDLHKNNESKCHQEIVIEGMQEELPWGWRLPPNAAHFWERKVSPPYFIGCSVTLESDMDKLASKIQESLSEIKEIDLSDLKVKSLEVKFYEFAFGSVSIKTEGSKLSKDQIDLNKAFENFRVYVERNIREILDCIAEKVTNFYRESVPCCIKNSDIWDINNFGGLEATEGMCGIGSVQEINTVVAMKHSNETNSINLISELKKVFVDFSKKLRKPPFNGSYNLFSTKEQNTTIAVSKTQNYEELERINNVFEVLGVQFALGRYFDNFFHSHYNYTSIQYEIVESRDHIFWKNLWGFKNLIEKFLDVQATYFQIKDLASKNMIIPNYDEYASKLHSTFPKSTTIYDFFNKADQKMNQIEKQYDKMKFIATKYSTLSVGLLPIIISISSLSISIAALLSDNSLLNAFAIAVIALILSYSSLILFISLKLKSRKLHFLCKPQKRNLKDQYKMQEKRNEEKDSFACNLEKCHRCQSNIWHQRVFYRKNNRHFQSRKTREAEKDDNKLVEVNVSNKFQRDKWYSCVFYSKGNQFFDVKKRVAYKKEAIQN